MSVAVGTWFSIVLVGTYLPAAVIERSRARHVAATQNPPIRLVQQRMLLQQNGFGDDWSLQIARLNTALSPLVAGTSVVAMLRLISG